MAKQEIEIVREFIYYSYANLAMAHTAVDKKQEKYDRFNFMIRAKLFKGLKDGTMNMRTIFDDEKVKLQTGQVCNYCGSAENLALDHIFPQKNGGKDDAENLIFACKTCNSSKGKKDLMEWMAFRGEFLPLMIIRRYLKLVFNYCSENELLDKKIEELKSLNLPFKIDLLPIKFPNPKELKLTMTEKKNTIPSKKVKHEIWESPDRLTTLCLADERGNDCRNLLESNSKLIHTFYAENHYEAMTIYYKYMDWGIYTTDFEIDKKPYND